MKLVNKSAAILAIFLLLQVTEGQKSSIVTAKIESTTVTGDKRTETTIREVTGSVTSNTEEKRNYTSTTENQVEHKSTGSPSHTGSYETEGVTGTATHSETKEASTSQETTTEPKATSPRPTYPPGDKRNCNVTKTLQLPGNGWDNLNYNEKHSIISLNYTKCQLTLDGKYLLPDGLVGVPYEEVRFIPEVFNSLNDYTNLTAMHLKDYSDLDEYNDVIGTYSPQVQHWKEKAYKSKAFLVRVYKQVSKYQINFGSGKLPFTEEFKENLVNISEYLINGHSEAAAFYSDLFVAQYGTHFIKQVNTGGVLVTEQLVQSTYADLKRLAEIISTEHIAKKLFAEKFHLPDYVETATSADIKGYEGAIVETKDTVIGGDHKEGKISNYKAWEKSIKENPETVIDRRGELLYTLITPINFPDIPRPILERLNTAIRDAIIRYFRYNRHSGCTNPLATNFKLSANHDDRSCNASNVKQFEFGGVYQKCSESSGEHDVCSTLDKKNPVTNDYSCPKHFEAIELRDKGFERYFNNSQEKDGSLICYGYDEDCKRGHSQGVVITRVEFKTYWCALTDETKEVKGVPFGGIFTNKIKNTNTNHFNCPSDYDDVVISENIHVCVGKGGHTDVAVEFGGFYSCHADNPLIYPFPAQICPLGYHSKLATVDGRCAVNYCVNERSVDKDQTFFSLVPPSSGEPPEVKDNTLTLVISDTKNGDIYYRKNGSESWKLAHSYEELEAAGLGGLIDSSKFEKNVHDESDEGGMSGGAVAGVVIATLAVLLAIVAVTGYFYMKKRGGMQRSDSTVDLHSSEAQPEDSHQRSGSGHGSRTASGTSASEVPQEGHN